MCAPILVRRYRKNYIKALDVDALKTVILYVT